MQNGMIVAYASRQLKKHKQNYPTHDLEVVVVIFTLKTWRHYWYGVTYEIFTDSGSLKKMSDQENSLILQLMMKAFCGPVEGYMFLMWKWKRITMDLVVGLARSRDGYDSIWANYGQVNQVSSFLPVKATHSVAKLAKLYIKHIVCLHGVPVSIASDRGSIFTSRFGKNCRKQWAPDLIS